ncbi:gamma-glutamylcyclotransferase [Leisingera sp. HS039]|uniref:gamma-glutamylcyclotransferase family protein n=1 Tax=unclassified Leisingera TaxID=2614906 RepID=UPI0010708AB3|nr:MULTISPECIES: gamma-glutamylcyclotransferase family protein [unclassified Leisingera]MBQ4825211.1 gamma-glutamylcyclotransferase [Leisingera sp. HS039]QBR35056.1 gamma-glutamylcyclotransferase [Leisingera sp. NJS201]
MTAPYFFGYGSLVNTATHAYGGAAPARLRGWRRAWVHTALREVAFLSAVPCADSEIDGLIAEVPGADWAALDEREFAYDRLPASGAVQHGLGGAPEISVYAVAAENKNGITARHPILLSYLDVVLLGYLQVFGEAGLHGFVATTDGWDAPVLNDRAAPRYPRHQPVSVAERKLFDELIDSTGSRRIVSGS